MPGLHHREPGPVLTAAHDERVTLEAIADNVHLHPHVIRLVFDEAPGRVALVTDAMAAAGSADGDYLLGSLHVTVLDGVARVDSGSIAGSTLTQDVALRKTVAAGVPLADAVEALTRTPARAIGVAEQLGALDRASSRMPCCCRPGSMVRGCGRAPALKLTTARGPGIALPMRRPRLGRSLPPRSAPARDPGRPTRTPVRRSPCSPPPVEMQAVPC